ncbi:hypothetical protein ON010_g17475 [Phytophthora cinnamomi]|nr:hypothetical protein ON010_g17475 [Phytophthora cinnamomi]
MRLFVVNLIVSTFITSVIDFTWAEGTAEVAAPVAANKVRLLRGSHKLDEDRMMMVAPVGAFWGAVHLNRADSTLSTQSSTISHAVREKIPLPKWAKALAVLGGWKLAFSRGTCQAAKENSWQVRPRTSPSALIFTDSRRTLKFEHYRYDEQNGSLMPTGQQHSFPTLGLKVAYSKASTYPKNLHYYLLCPAIQMAIGIKIPYRRGSQPPRYTRQKPAQSLRGSSMDTIVAPSTAPTGKESGTVIIALQWLSSIVETRR